MSILDNLLKHIPPSILGKFEPTAWLLAQETHLLLGILAIVFCKAFNLPLWWGVVGMLGFAALKETTFDVWVEKNPFLYSGLVDFAMYCVGISIGYGLVFFVSRLL